MATYAIGDIQGCFSALEKLLQKINFHAEEDVLWSVGDLVNRGPQSLEALRFYRSLGDKHRLVLGNHDLHLLGVAYGVREQQPTDTLQSILQAPDRDDLIEWLCHRPLLVHDAKTNYVMTHAGLAPSWTLLQAKSIANELEVMLQGSMRVSFLKKMHGNLPDIWSDDLIGFDRHRCAVNYLTRMRFCYPDGRLNFSYQGDIQHKPADLIPWFEWQPRFNTDLKIIFGHWAALRGKLSLPNLYALDTGCVWGKCLTAMRLEDETRFSVSC